jgi:hypothetical protein
MTKRILNILGDCVGGRAINSDQGAPICAMQAPEQHGKLL